MVAINTNGKFLRMELPVGVTFQELPAVLTTLVHLLLTVGIEEERKLQLAQDISILEVLK